MLMGIVVVIASVVAVLVSITGLAAFVDSVNDALNDTDEDEPVVTECMEERHGVKRR